VQRVIVPELLDNAPPAEAEANLRDLIRINRWFGGYRILRSVFSDFVGKTDAFSVLDVGAASGDMGAALRRQYPRAEITSLDYRANHLSEACPPRVVADAFALPLREHSFDFVFSSLFLHHFQDRQIVELFSSFKWIARRAVLAIDLDRGPLAYHFLPATKWLFGWHDITLHDGPISVHAGFRKDELLRLAQAAGLSNALVKTHRPWARLSLVAPL